MAFAYPDFAKDILQKGKLDANKVCLACSACTQIMRDGGMTGCVIRDNKIYGPIYKHGRMSNKDNLLRLATSCLQCQEPTCRQACPAGIDIPQFISQFLEGHEKSAYETIRQANVLPEVCAWLCPVEQQCEGHCLQTYIGDGSVPIADIQRYLAEQANRKGWSKLNVSEVATGKNVAIIGAGPAGLACAAVLIREGHTVTIYDKGKTIGGMIRSVIPSERQGQSLSNEIDAIFRDVPSDRMILRLGTELNAEFNLDQIMGEGFDAAFIGMGLPNAMVSSDEHIDGVWNALDFLAAARGENQLDLTGKHVAVIGGGNTAMDAAVAAKQHGAEDVYVIYRRSFDEMPAWPDERDRAMTAGVHFLILTQQLSYHAEQGKLAWVTVCPTRLGKPDSSGRRAPEPIKASSYAFNIDVAIEAIGQEPPSDLERLMPGVTIENGRIRTKDNSFETHRPRVFAGGDLVRGASTVVAAVADGMAAASQIDRFLKDQHNPCPQTGRDTHVR
jgi:glutamate synthase (NADPH/NADH) small chain